MHVGGMGNMGAMRTLSQGTTIDVMVMRIVTRFTSVDEFVSAFRKFCGEGTCFIPSAQAKRVGIETGFSIRLADGTPMLRGLCVVLDSWATAENPYGRPGVRLGIRSLTAESKPVFQRLLLVGAVAAPESDEHTKATVEMAPLFPADERAPHSEFVLPANPLTEMSDVSLQAFVDCTLFEDAIPDHIGSRDAGIDDATGRIEDDRNDPPTRKIETTERIEPSAPKATSLERALAAAASATVRLDGGTQRIERLESPQARARELADEQADSAFGAMLAHAADRIEPVADHTVPTQMPPELVDLVRSGAPSSAVSFPPARLTILGVAPLVQPTPRVRISMPAITDPEAQSAVATPFPSPAAVEATASTTALIHRPVARRWWRRVTARLRGVYTRLVWARRRRRAALRG